MVKVLCSEFSILCFFRSTASAYMREKIGTRPLSERVAGQPLDTMLGVAGRCWALLGVAGRCGAVVGTFHMKFIVDSSRIMGTATRQTNVAHRGYLCPPMLDGKDRPLMVIGGDAARVLCVGPSGPRPGRRLPCPSSPRVGMTAGSPRRAPPNSIRWLPATTAVPAARPPPRARRGRPRPRPRRAGARRRPPPWRPPSPVAVALM